MNLGRLDYPAEKLQPFGRDKLVMEANTEIEQSMRLNACAKEPFTVELIESLSPGEVFWDVGANVGSYTLLAAARQLATVAFEPVSENYGTLCRNLALNGMLDSVVTLPIALGPATGLTWFHRMDMRSGAASHFVSDDPHKRSFHKQMMPVLPADQAQAMFGLPWPHAIKLDVDGGEQDVLAGAVGILACESLRHLLVELHQEWDGACTVWLAEHGWELAERYEDRGPVYYAKFGRKVEAKVPVEVAA